MNLDTNTTEPSDGRRKLGKHSFNLRKNEFLRFQIGLVVAMALVYFSLEASFHAFEDAKPLTHVTLIDDQSIWIDPSVIRVEHDQKIEKKTPKRVSLQRIKPMPDDIDPITTKVIMKPASRGDNIVGPIDYVEPEEPEDYNIIVVQELPIFPGCEGISERDEQMKCLNEKVVGHISRKFRADGHAKKGELRIFVKFSIDANGNSNVEAVRAPTTSLEKEAIRVIEKLPSAKPGKVNGKPVKVLYTVPIKVKID